jgi:DNA-binding winged helix-turn-helix (wHTH) protein/Tfp pilus assembly protein PilF
MNTHSIFRIADVELDVERYELRRGGVQIPLERQPMELLIMMALRHEQLVTRADIARSLWGGSAFRETDNGINTAIRKIRVALGESPEQPEYLVTVKGKGYRLNVTPPDGEEVASLPGDALRMLVLPFSNHTTNRAFDPFCDALADEISAAIGAMNPAHVLVIARTTAAQYRTITHGIADIGRHLSLDYILEGSVAIDGTQMRILTQLVRCVDQVQVWSAAYEPASQGHFDICRELRTAFATDVMSAVAASGLHPLNRRSPINPAAHDDWLRGRFYWTRRVHFDAGFAAHHGLSDEDFVRALAYFESAVERDPTYALGYVGLSNVFGSTAAHGFYAPKDGYPRAREAALHALQLDANLPEAHQALAGVHYFYDWDWRRAEAEFLEALRINPSHAETSRLYARLLLVQGRDAEGRAQFERAERADPIGFEGSRVFGLVQSGQYDEAIAEYCLHEGRAHSPLVHQLVATAFEIRGLYEEAVEATVEALFCSNAFGRAEKIREAWDAGGYRDVLQWYLRDLTARAAEGYISPFLFAELYARLAQPEPMFRWLEASLVERSPRMCELKTNPWFRRFRSMGRFRSVEKRIGL